MMMEDHDDDQSPQLQPPTIDDGDKPLTYSQRFKEECSQAAGLCLWDKIVESFKVKGKGDDATDGVQYNKDRQRVDMGELEEQQRQALDEQKQRYEYQLQQQREEFEGKLELQNEEYQQKTQESQETIQALEEQLRISKKTSHDQKSLMDKVQQYEFIVPNFRQLKEEKKPYTVPAMYSHPGGYKFSLEVFPAGMGTGSGTYVSIRAWSHKGEFDAQLTFPAKIHITLQLLNQHTKVKGHHTKHIACLYKDNEEGTFLGADQQFIGFGGLEWNDHKETIYLKDNRLWFRVIEVRVDALTRE